MPSPVISYHVSRGHPLGSLPLLSICDSPEDVTSGLPSQLPASVRSGVANLTE